MVRVVGKEGALGAGGGGNCSSGMDGSKNIMIYVHTSLELLNIIAHPLGGGGGVLFRCLP